MEIDIVSNPFYGLSWGQQPAGLGDSMFGSCGGRLNDDLQNSRLH